MEDLTSAVMQVAEALRALGNSNANTQMGAIEAMGAVFRDQLESISVSIGAGATEISDALNNVAEAIRQVKK